jgi:alanine-glyoxylate transaminase/serine-glyoxylate transaminase/serine-pyruvate transaminase
MCDIVERCGARLVRVDASWGAPVDPAQVKKALETCRPKLVAIVHAETSTGVLQPLEEIGRLAHEAGALFVVDAVTSLGGVDVRVDDWGIDAVYSGSQKCLSAPSKPWRGARPRCRAGF